MSRKNSKLVLALASCDVAVMSAAPISEGVLLSNTCAMPSTLVNLLLGDNVPSAVSKLTLVLLMASLFLLRKACTQNVDPATREGVVSAWQFSSSTESVNSVGAFGSGGVTSSFLPDEPLHAASADAVSKIPSCLIVLMLILNRCCLFY